MASTLWSDSTQEIVLRFGKRTRTREGFSYSMNNASRHRARRELGDEYRNHEGRDDIYLVIGLDERRIITVAHRLQKLKAA